MKKREYNLCILRLISHFTTFNHFDYSNKEMTSNHRLNVKLKQIR